jgi:hypothetical protein
MESSSVDPSSKVTLLTRRYHRIENINIIQLAVRHYLRLMWLDVAAFILLRRGEADGGSRGR